MGYIYKITNLINGKVYIGKTERNIQIRWKEHCKNISRLQRLPLYKALKKYGINNFTIEEIEQCNISQLDQREIYWISFYNSYIKGYNCTEGGEGGIKTFKEDIDIIIQRYLKGERLDLLCKEYHHDYSRIRAKMIAKGVQIDSKAGPKKLSKAIAAIHPETKEIVKVYESIIAAGRAICAQGKEPRSIANHISKYKNTSTISHGYLWKTIEKGEF